MDEDTSQKSYSETTAPLSLEDIELSGEHRPYYTETIYVRETLPVPSDSTHSAKEISFTEGAPDEDESAECGFAGDQSKGQDDSQSNTILTNIEDVFKAMSDAFWDDERDLSSDDEMFDAVECDVTDPDYLASFHEIRNAAWQTKQNATSTLEEKTSCFRKISFLQNDVNKMPWCNSNKRKLEKAVQDLNDHGTLLQKILDTTNDEEWIRSILQRLCHARGKLNLYKGFYGSLEQKLSSNDVYRLHTQRNIDRDVAYYSQQTSAEATYNPETSIARLRLTSEPLQWEGVMIGYEALKWTNSVIENMERDVNRLTKELRYTFSKRNNRNTTQEPFSELDEVLQKLDKSNVEVNTLKEQLRWLCVDDQFALHKVIKATENDIAAKQVAKSYIIQAELERCENNCRSNEGTLLAIIETQTKELDNLEPEIRRLMAYEKDIVARRQRLDCVYEQIWRLSDYKTSLENRLHHLKKMITEIEDQKTRDLSNQKHTMQILSTLNTEDLRLIQLCDEKLKMYNNIDRQGIPHRGSLSQFRGSLERIRYNIERISMCTDHNSRIHGVLLSEITSAFR